jgi:hypothetical protein
MTDTPAPQTMTPDELTAYIDAKVAEGLAASATPPTDAPTDPPAAPPPTGKRGKAEDGVTRDTLDAAVAKAVTDALARRDGEDALTYLTEEVRKIREQVGATAAPAKAGWGRMLVGLGVLQ